MAINKKAKAAEAENAAQDLTLEVTRVKDFSKDGSTAIAFDLKVNGVTIYNCWYREGEKDGKEYSMVSFPSRKDEKSGKYYNHAYVKLSEDQVTEISKQIETML